MLPVDGPLPFAPGVEPDPASFAPVLFAVPDRLVGAELFSAASVAEPASSKPATASVMTFIAYLPVPGRSDLRRCRPVLPERQLSAPVPAQLITQDQPAGLSD
jgi:hypothetical protein